MKRCAKISCWTDYPFLSLGDIEGQRAPIRRVTVVHDDQKKYATAITKEGTLSRRKLERMISTLPMEMYECVVTQVHGDRMWIDLRATIADNSKHTIAIRLADVPFVRESSRFTLTLNATPRLRPATAQAAQRVIAFKR